MSIKIKDLTKVYDSFGQRIEALGGVSLDIADGEFVAVIGESGSGKSTLLNILCGMERADGGEVILDGERLSTLDADGLAKLRRTDIGVIYQFYNLLPELSVRDNITLPAELDGKTPDESRLCEILERVGLLGRERDFPSQLSGGQQQRVAIARALYQSPRLILADEPTGNLDERCSEEIMDMLCELNCRDGMTLVVVTHSPKVADRATRIIRLSRGTVAEDRRRE